MRNQHCDNQLKARTYQTLGIRALIWTVALGVVPASAFSQMVTAPTQTPDELRARLARGMNPPGRSMPSDMAELDAMLTRGAFTPLVARLQSVTSAQSIDLDMNWEQSRLFGGAGFIVGYTYMHDLWRVGSAMPTTTGEGLKQSAAMIFLYNFDLVSVDGPTCADITAPGHRSDQLVLQNAPIVAYLKSLPVATRMQLGTISLAIEAATASKRTKDEVLCSGGLDQISAGLAAQGSKPLPKVPSAPGNIGETYAVPTAPGYKIKFVNDAIALPKQIAARAALPRALTEMLTAPAKPVTTAPLPQK